MTDKSIQDQILALEEQAADLCELGHELHTDLCNIDPATVEYAEAQGELRIVAHELEECEKEIARLQEIAG